VWRRWVVRRPCRGRRSRRGKRRGHWQLSWAAPRRRRFLSHAHAPASLPRRLRRPRHAVRPVPRL